MTVELPKFNKCCFCLPLRAGLLGWAYFKIIANAIITLILAYFILSTLVMSLYGTNRSYRFTVLLYSALILIIFLLFITDFVATIIFVVAGHKKNAKMIRGHFVYNVGVLVVTTLLIVAGVIIAIQRWSSSDTTMYLLLIAAYLLTLVVQAYYTLLVRSEAIKLETSGEFRFVHNSPEAQCMMTNKAKGAEVNNV